MATAIIVGAAIGAPIASHFYPAAIGRVAPLASFFNSGAADPALPDRAAPTNRAACKRQYYSGEAPAYVHRGLKRRTTTVCYSAFAVGYSGITRTPLWSAERLTAEAVASGKGFNRDGMEFHPDAHVPGRDRALLSDYRRSGWSRGHMAPSADMPTPAARQESFTLANVVPQDDQMNSELWNDIEQAVRRLATKRGTIYVVTGPVFPRGKVDSLNDRVAIPAAIYKAVLIPGEGAAVYYAANTPERRMAIVSVAQLARLAGIDPFPEASAATKARAIELSPARPGRRSHRFQAW